MWRESMKLKKEGKKRSSKRRRVEEEYKRYTYLANMIANTRVLLKIYRFDIPNTTYMIILIYTV